MLLYTKSEIELNILDDNLLFRRTERLKQKKEKKVQIMNNTSV